MQTQIEVRRKNTIWSKLCQCSGLLLFSLILTACSQGSDPQQGVISDDKLSVPFPKAITALLVNDTNLIVDVVVNGDTDNPLRVKNLVVDTTAGIFSGNVPGFPTGTSTLSLVYSIIDPALGTVEVIRTSGITVNVVANQETPADFSSADIFYTDTDGDSISNLDELDAGTSISIANYIVGGQVEGLTGSGLVLQNNGSDNLTISANGTFSFSPAMIDGGEYAVSILTQPGSPNQVCTVNNGSGTVSGAAVSSVTVICSTVSYTVGGSVSGYTGSDLVLQNNDGDNLPISANGTFSFSSAVADGSNYTVTVLTQPNNPNQVCTVNNGSSTVSGAAVSGVTVICSTDSYTVGGIVSGYAGSGLVLQNNGSDDLAINAEGNFTFSSAVADGSNYTVTVLTQPNSPNQVCTISNGSGALSGAAISNVSVTCSTTSYTVGGTVSSYAGSGLVLQNNDGDDLTINAEGSFTFSSALADGSNYSVTVLAQPYSPGQICTISNGSGTVSGAAVSNVSVICSTIYTVGGTVSGYAGGGLLVLRNSDGDDLPIDDLPINANGTFSFSSALVDGSNYSITVLVQPTNSPNQTCTVSNGSGTLSGAAVSNVSVTCSTNTYTVGGTVSGYAGSGLVLQNDGSDDLTISANGTFTFSPAMIDGGEYAVTVLTQPNSPNQVCTVSNGSGTLNGAAISNISVICNTAPTATSVSIADANGGSTVVGDSLSGNYTYTDAESDTEGTSTFRWLRDGSVITGATTSSYVLVASDSGKTITFEVIPVASTGITTGSVAGSDGLVIMNSAPVFTSGVAINMAENTTATDYTATAMDVDGDTVTFSLSGGTDQGAFSIDSDSGVLSFSAAPDFEIRTDSNGNNTYVVEITATDGTHPVVRSVTVTVTDILEVTVSTVNIKTARFEWSAYAGTTNYKLFVNPDGVSGFSLLQDNLSDTSTTITLPVHLTDWINARYILEAHDASGNLTTTPPVSITMLMLSSIGYIKASNTGENDWFGSAVSLSGDGNTLAVGAWGEQSAATGVITDGSGQGDNTSAVGAVYVFRRNGGIWVQQAYVKASNSAEDDLFGSAVSLSDDGNTLAVGAAGEDSIATGVSTDGNGEANNWADQSGAVYVFSRSSGIWMQQAYVKASNTGDGDEFGSAVSLSGDGNTLVVGAIGEDNADTGTGGNGQADNTADGSGAVYVFSRSGDVWSQQAYVKASNTGVGDWFGSAVSLSGDGNTLAVGAYQEDSAATGVSTYGSGEADNTAGSSGAVYVFSRSSDAWSQQAYVKASNTGFNDLFGYTVSLSGDGNTLAVGAFRESSIATGISTDGSNEADNTANASGAVYVFGHSDSVWNQQAYVKASNTGVGDFFGYAVSLSGDGNTLAVGAWVEDSVATGVSTDGSGEDDNTLDGPGAAYVFSRSSGVWSQQAYVKASNTGKNDVFGSAVSLSGDGNTLAVGAEKEGSAVTGISTGGSSGEIDNSASGAGAVYLY